MTHHGSCLCNAIEYEFDAEPIACVHCHCTDCQKATGSGFATVFGLPEEEVKLTGIDTIGRYTLAADSGQSVTRLFCTTCGSQLFTEAQNNPGFLWIKAGSLHDSDWLKPTDSCWTGSAVSWAPADPSTTLHEGNP